MFGLVSREINISTSINDLINDLQNKHKIQLSFDLLVMQPSYWVNWLEFHQLDKSLLSPRLSNKLNESILNRNDDMWIYNLDRCKKKIEWICLLNLHVSWWNLKPYLQVYANHIGYDQEFDLTTLLNKNNDFSQLNQADIP